MQRLWPDPGSLDGAAEVEDHYLLPPGPHVRANFVISLDGAVELGGRSSPLAGPADRLAFMAMRAVADVILVGAGTVREENYGPVKLDLASVDRRRSRDQVDLPPLAIVTNRGLLDPDARVFSGVTRPLLLTTRMAADSHVKLEAAAEVIECGDQFVELDSALEELRRRGLDRVLCEGGPTLLRSLVEADALDELCLTTSPFLAGWGHHTLVSNDPLSAPLGFTMTSVAEGDGMLLCRYGRQA
jgi:riboflavin biosynthesis pyrimidine reductase